MSYEFFPLLLFQETFFTEVRHSYNPLRKRRSLRRVVAIALVAIILVTAGCNGFVDSGDSTDEGAPETAPKTTAPITTTSVSQTPTPSPQEQGYITSGKEFTRVMAKRTNETHGMFPYNRGFYPNNTVSMTFRLDDGTPLYKSMMNVTQTVSLSSSQRARQPMKTWRCKTAARGKSTGPRWSILEWSIGMAT